MLQRKRITRRRMIAYELKISYAVFSQNPHRAFDADLVLCSIGLNSYFIFTKP